MLPSEVSAAIISAGCGWAGPDGPAVLATDAIEGVCNSVYCRTLATAAAAAGVTATAVGAAVAEYVAGDDAPLLAILSG